MSANVFSMVRNGYDPAFVLMRLDEMNSLLYAVKSGTTVKDFAVAEAERLMAEPIPTARQGFSIADVDSYLEQMMGELRNL